MVTLTDLTDRLNALLEPDNFKDYAPNGLQVEGAANITKCATAVTASLAAIEAAVEAGVQALVVHHGYFWKGEAPQLVGTKRDRIKLLLDSGISLIGYHLPLDAHPLVGNNWAAARELGWNSLEPFGAFDGTTIGVQGVLSAPVTWQKFQEQLEAYYGQAANIAAGGNDQVSSVALISGGAHRQISQAVEAGVDAYVTGSHDEPIWHIAHEERIHFFGMGHSATERVGPRALSKWITDELGVECEFLDLENPF